MSFKDIAKSAAQRSAQTGEDKVNIIARTAAAHTKEKEMGIPKISQPPAASILSPELSQRRGWRESSLPRERVGRKWGRARIRAEMEPRHRSERYPQRPERGWQSRNVLVGPKWERQRRQRRCFNTPVTSGCYSCTSAAFWSPAADLGKSTAPCAPSSLGHGLQRSGLYAFRTERKSRPRRESGLTFLDAESFRARRYSAPLLKWELRQPHFAQPLRAMFRYRRADRYCLRLDPSVTGVSVVGNAIKDHAWRSWQKVR